MLMIVFGAGASYDSYPNLMPPDSHDGRPPLAKELFSNRAAFAQAAVQFPDFQLILPLLQKYDPHSSIEETLEGLQLEAATNKRRHAQFLALRHYLQFVITDCQHDWKKVHRGVTNYHTLLDELEAWRQSVSQKVCLVTFNYDTMLEEALLPAVGIKISDMPDYISQQYLLIKLHGSINWGRAVFNVPPPDQHNSWITVRQIISSAHLFKPKNEFRITSGRPIADIDGQPVIPAIAVPTVNKSEFECPPDHLNALISLLPNTTKILFVGWRGNEKHFISLIGTHIRNPVEIMIVSESLNSAEETKHNLLPANLGVRKGFKLFDRGFSDFVVNRWVRDFLN